MTSVTLGELRGILEDRFKDPDRAQRVLDQALGDCQLPAQESYSPQEIVAIGMAIAERSGRTLRGYAAPEAVELAQAFGPWIEVLKEETGQLIGG